MLRSLHVSGSQHTDVPEDTPYFRGVSENLECSLFNIEMNCVQIGVVSTFNYSHTNLSIKICT